MVAASGTINGVLNSKIDRIGCHRLGIKLDTGVFSITGANGLDLSNRNPGYVSFQSKSNPGQIINFTVTQNSSFTDASGSSDIIGNLFGFTTGVAIASDVPFFIYVVMNDNETDFTFMTSRIPGRTSTNSANNIGKPGTPAPTNSQVNWFAFEDITTSEYNDNPAICIGSFRMKMDASDDWTVSTIISSFNSGEIDGIGSYNTFGTFKIPPGQFGADAGALTIANGGTSPVFSSIDNATYRMIGNTPFCLMMYYMTGDGGTDGAGAVSARFTMPFVPFSNNAQGIAPCRIRTPTYSEAGLLQTEIGYFQIYRSASASTPILWSAFSNGAREIWINFLYQIHGAL